MPESQSDPPELRIQIVTASGYSREIDLLSDEVLAPFGKNKKDVQCVRSTNHFSGSVYTELELAGPHHPLIGSGSAAVRFRSGEMGEISDIFYQDYKEAGSHCDGKPHWNHQRRYMMEGWPKPCYEKQPGEPTSSIGHLGSKCLRRVLMEPASLRRCHGFRRAETLL